MADQSAIVTIPISPGEVIDRLTILEIKSERITDADKLANVRLELKELADVAGKAIPDTPEIQGLHAALRVVNEELWGIEDDIRDCERSKDFGETFIRLARAVYRTNDRRAELKREINETLGSRLTEEKSYAAY